MKEVSNGAKRIARKLFSDEATQQIFLSSIIEAKSGVDGVIFTKNLETLPSWCIAEPVWNYKHAYKLNAPREAALSALHLEGGCYLLENSSLFMASPITIISAASVLDVCASPGGKSVVAASQLRPQRMISNETIKKRLGSLHGNLQRCGFTEIKITSLDSGQLSERAGRDFELVIVDAPCSGQSLEARGEISAGCFLEVTVKKCAMRQRRILANSAACVISGGHLLYATCTYSYEENEQVVEWFLKNFPSFKTVEIPHLAAYQSTLTENFCYRLFPQQAEGSGGFTCLLINHA